MRKRTLFLFLTIAILAQAVSSQAKTALTVQCDQSGAKVYVEDKLAGYTQPNFTIMLLPGTYKLRVSKEGFPEYQSSVVVGASPVTVQVILGKGDKPTPPTKPPAPPPKPPIPRYQLSVDANLKGAQVYLNGTYVGVTPFSGVLEQGNYSLTVKIEGYDEYSSTLRLNGAARVYAVLSPRPIYIYIDAYNAPGANVYRDSTFVGTTPYRGAWMPGTYDLRIAAPGFVDYTDKLALRGPVTMSIALVASFAEYEFRLPEPFATKGGKPVHFEDLIVLLDGVRIISPLGTATIGSHHIDIYLDDLHFETSFDLPTAGKYILGPGIVVSTH